MAYKYYTDEYAQYDNELKDYDSLVNYTAQLVDSVDQASQMTDKLAYDVYDLSGMSVEELKTTTMGGVINNLNSIRNTIVEKLEPIMLTCASLSQGLKDIKAKEEDLNKEDASLTSLKNDPVGKGTYDEKTKVWSNQSNYDDYIERLDNLNSSIEKLIKACDELKKKDDNDIATIKSFNSTLEDFSNKLFSMSVSLGNQDFSNFQNMTTEEKKAIIEGLVKEMTDKYNELKRNLESGKREALFSVLNSLGCWYIDPYEPLSFSDLHAMMSFLNYQFSIPDGTPGGEKRTPVEIINAYFNGEEWYESGMELLSLQFVGYERPRDTSLDASDFDNRVQDLGTKAPSEREFWHNLLWNMAGQNNGNESEIFAHSSYAKEHGQLGLNDIYSLLSDPNAEMTFVGANSAQAMLSADLIHSLKASFVNEGKLTALNAGFEEIDNIYNSYGTDALPILAALDGKVDWTDDNSIIPPQVINDYLNGKSWEESGLSKYAGKSEEEFILDLSKIYGIQGKEKVEQVENGYYRWNLEFDERDGYFDICSIDRGELQAKIAAGEDISEYIKEIKQNLVNEGTVDNLNDYYKHMSDRNTLIKNQEEELEGLGEAIYNLKKIDKLVPYLEVQSSDKYKEFVASGKIITEAPDGLDKGLHDGYDYNNLFKNMNDKEKEMFSYLCETKGLDSARSYLADNAATINERIGVARATSFVKNVRGNNVISQEDYAKQYAQDHNVTMEEARKATLDKLQSDYAKVLVNQYGYNPQRALEEAQAHDFTNANLTTGNIIDSIGDGLQTIGAGTWMGTKDLGTNIWHIVSPDMVKTPDNYEAEHIVSMFNDQESDYYDPALAVLYSGTRTLGHKGPAAILKAIPATKVIGEGLEIADNMGEKVNTAYQKNGGDYLSALAYGGVDATISVTAKRISPLVEQACDKAGIESKATRTVLSTFAASEYKSVATATNEFLFIDGDTGKLVNKVEKGSANALIEAGFSTFKPTGITENAHVNAITKDFEKNTLGAVKGTFQEAAGDAIDGKMKTVADYAKSANDRFAKSYDPSKRLGNDLVGLAGNTAKSLSDSSEAKKTVNEALATGAITDNGTLYTDKNGNAWETKQDAYRQVKEDSKLKASLDSDSKAIRDAASRLENGTLRYNEEKGYYESVMETRYTSGPTIERGEDGKYYDVTFAGNTLKEATDYQDSTYRSAKAYGGNYVVYVDKGTTH